MAASVGLLLAFDIRIFPICAVLFFGTFFLTHYVSLSSLLAYLGFFVSILNLWSDRNAGLYTAGSL